MPQPVDDVVQDSEPEGDDLESDTVLLLSRFAYRTTHAHSASSRTLDPAPSRPACLVRKDPPDNSYNSQLSNLSTCIGCGQEWTSRKTAKQKLTHVNQCAKKRGLTKDTVEILVEKEIAISSSTQKIACPRVDLNDITLMDSVVPAGPVKKSKRQQVLSTVRSLPETRDNILNRARDILGPADGQASPQSIQQFGQSGLARRNTRHPKRPALLDINSFVGEPPSTQPFRASSLRAATIPAKQPVDGCEELSFLHSGTSLFAQDSILAGHKRPTLPSPLDDSRTVKRRLLQ